MPRTTATVTTKTEVTIAPKVKRDLLTQLNAYATITGEMKALKEAKEGHSAAVLELADAHVGGEKFSIEGFKVAVVKGARDKRLDKQALIKRLVADGKYSMKAALALIEDCTSDKPKKDFVKITCPHEQDSEEE